MPELEEAANTHTNEPLPASSPSNPQLFDSAHTCRSARQRGIVTIGNQAKRLKKSMGNCRAQQTSRCVALPKKGSIILLAFLKHLRMETNVFGPKLCATCSTRGEHS